MLKLCSLPTNLVPGVLLRFYRKVKISKLPKVQMNAVQVSVGCCRLPKYPVPGFIPWQPQICKKNYRLPPSNRRCWRRCPDTVRLFSAQHRDICVFLKHRPRLHLEGGRWSSCITASHLLSSWGEVKP